ncbi:hypothetical protein A3K86_14155 [Photobacterium jeanii]|uniref:PTS cellbiose transporter n=1 Tax=Photobacterium jeanii TaxID=858640 RepID=A0A178K8Q8_9GAMM|nr:carbohydrate deacetylase [Photobacterium jeanii]OAN13711.1 hypothetical protein A3K86_14155 [Photobacterium jeanii]PST88832.1 carbohydrate deacetylase [Photobacterium jeanii]
MKLIINADDFGLTPKVNQAITECMAFGLVKSTTLMVNQPGTQDAIARIKRREVPDVGLHLNLTLGRPVLAAQQVPSLVNSEGQFYSRAQLTERLDQVDVEQVYQELSAQYRWAEQQGIAINHLDTHHFAAVQPKLREAYIAVANEVGLPSRRIDMELDGQDGLTVMTPDAFDMHFFDRGVSHPALQGLLAGYRSTLTEEQVLEIMCHPGLMDDEPLTSLSSYRDMRFQETQILTSPQLRDWLEEQQIEVMGYHDFARYKSASKTPS